MPTPQEVHLTSEDGERHAAERDSRSSRDGVLQDEKAQNQQGIDRCGPTGAGPPAE